jgi:hypothetical protein
MKIGIAFSGCFSSVLCWSPSGDWTETGILPPPHHVVGQNNHADEAVHDPSTIARIVPTPPTDKVEAVAPYSAEVNCSLSLLSEAFST